jgi:hypothetical protein
MATNAPGATRPVCWRFCCSNGFVSTQNTRITRPFIGLGNTALTPPHSGELGAHARMFLETRPLPVVSNRHVGIGLPILICKPRERQDGARVPQQQRPELVRSGCRYCHAYSRTCATQRLRGARGVQQQGEGIAQEDKRQPRGGVATCEPARFDPRVSRGP